MGGTNTLCGFVRANAGSDVEEQDQRCTLCEPYNPPLVVLNFVVCSRARVERAPVVELLLLLLLLLLQFVTPVRHRVVSRKDDDGGGDDGEGDDEDDGDGDDDSSLSHRLVMGS